MEQVFHHGETPLLFFGWYSSLGVLILTHSGKLTPEGLISNPVEAASSVDIFFPHSPSLVKLPYCRVTNSSIISSPDIFSPLD